MRPGAGSPASVCRRSSAAFSLVGALSNAARGSLKYWHQQVAGSPRVPKTRSASDHGTAEIGSTLRVSVCSPELTMRSEYSCDSARFRDRRWATTHGCPGLSVHGELEDILTRVVPGHVEVVLAAHLVAQVDVGNQQRAFAVDGAGEHLAERRDDHAAPANQFGRRVVSLHGVVVVRTVCAGEVLAGAEHEHPPLVGDVAHAGLPDLAVVDGRRAPQLDALLVGGEPQLGHVVLPADGGGEPAGGGVEHFERGAVALAPDE